MLTVDTKVRQDSGWYREHPALRRQLDPLAELTRLSKISRRADVEAEL